MKEDTYAKLVASIKEAGEIKAGHRPPSRTYEIPPPEIRMVRDRLDVSQGEFAVMIGVSTRTLQNWEQGRRQPEGPAKALLTVASRNPTAVLDALHGKRTGPTSKFSVGLPRRWSAALHECNHIDSHVFVLPPHQTMP
jgi:putative transcriptional regulator